MDMKPTMTLTSDSNFAIQVVESEFKYFTPDYLYDCVLFESCLGYVSNYDEIK